MKRPAPYAPGPLLAAVMLAGLVLRLYGLDWGTHWRTGLVDHSGAPIGHFSTTPATWPLGTNGHRWLLATTPTATDSHRSCNRPLVAVFT